MSSLSMPDAARRNVIADGRGLVGAVDAVERVAEIQARAPSGLPGPPAIMARQIRLALDHLRRRKPVRPFLHLGDALGARPGEALAADADAVAHRLAAAEHQIEIGVRRIDDDGAGRLLGGEVDQLPLADWPAVPWAGPARADPPAAARQCRTAAPVADSPRCRGRTGSRRRADRAGRADRIGIVGGALRRPLLVELMA